jgi:5'-3' exonuclease
MGVRKLNKFLVNKNLVIPYDSLSEFVEKKRNNNNIDGTHIVIAVDFWLYAHKFLHSTRSDDILLGFWNQIIKFMSSGIIPLYVMDGMSPFEKKDKNDERERRKNNYARRFEELNEEIENCEDDKCDNDIRILLAEKKKLQKHVKRINHIDLQNIKRLFDIFGVPYVRATYEADSLCAKLFREKIITSCLSDDMDMLALGCGSTIKFNDGKIIEFNLDHINENLGLTQNQFVDMCILFGCDYLKHPFRLDCDEIYLLIKKHGSLLGALSSGENNIFNMYNPNIRVIGENYHNVQNIYLNNHEREFIPETFRNMRIPGISLETLILFLDEISINKNIKKTKDIVDNLNNLISLGII